jgi:hypothetical protein
MAISVFVAEIGKTEYKSQIKKRKAKKQEKVIKDKMLDDATLDVQSEPVRL